MKIIVPLLATSVFFLSACSGTDSQVGSLSDSDSPAVKAETELQDHPDFIRKMADPANYRVNREGIEPFSICGSDDKQYVNSYNGSLGVSIEYVKTHKGPVGAMETSASDAQSAKYCSGTLIANNVFLTAGHCVDSSTVGDYVAFNYERAPNSTQVLQQTHVRIDAIIEDGLGGLDYAILRLAGSPGSTFGVARTNITTPANNALLAILQHPARLPKQIEAGTHAGVSGNFLTYGNIDTEGGSSGSGIRNANGEVVGVHTHGGCTSSGGTNRGTRLSAVAPVSNYL